MEASLMASPALPRLSGSALGTRAMHQSRVRPSSRASVPSLWGVQALRGRLVPLRRELRHRREASFAAGHPAPGGRFAVRGQLLVEQSGGSGEERENGAVAAGIPAGFVQDLEKQIQKPTVPGPGDEVIKRASPASAEAPNGSAVGAVAGVAAGAVAGSGNAEEEQERLQAAVDTQKAWFSADSYVQVAQSPGGQWNRFKTYSTIQRTFEIWSFVFAFAFRWWLLNQRWAYSGGVTEEKKSARRRDLAKWLKEGLLRLGPTFIKLGQQFSTRVDVLPQEYIDQLAELQDQVPPFESEVAVAIVEKELGAPVHSVFDRFDRIPIAAASLGQVHRARVQGREVVVKVQRPGLKELFDIDLKNLRVLAINLQKFDPKSDGAKRDWVAIYDECASVLYDEIDYTKEAKNAQRFAQNFQDKDWIRVPDILWDYTTPQILTMQYLPGIKINRTELLDELGVDRKRIARLSVESYLEQILTHGFFHADPHPGNIAVDNVNGGRLIFYDFGMMGGINSDIREGLVEAFYGVYQKNPDKVLDAMVQMGVLVPTGDMVSVRRTAQFFLDSFEQRLEAQRKEREEAAEEERRLGFKKSLSTEEKAVRKKERLAAIGEDLLAIAVDQPFRFPATFTFVVRAFSVLDGIGKGLDPRFDISEIAKPYAQDLLQLRRAGYEVLTRDLKDRWDRQAQAFANLIKGPDRVQRLENVVRRLEQGDLKLRVRTLESERSFKRVAQVQSNIGKALLAATLLNIGTTLYTSSAKAPATACLVASGLVFMKLLVGMLKVKRLDTLEAQITGTA